MATAYVPEKTRTFEHLKTELQALMKELNTKCDALCSEDPDWMTWAQVGDMQRLVKQLREIDEP